MGIGLIIACIIIILTVLKTYTRFWLDLIPGVIQHIAVSDNGEFLCSIADDKSLKIFDVINFGKQLKINTN